MGPKPADARAGGEEPPCSRSFRASAAGATLHVCSLGRERGGGGDGMGASGAEVVEFPQSKWRFSLAGASPSSPSSVSVGIFPRSDHGRSADPCPRRWEPEAAGLRTGPAAPVAGAAPAPVPVASSSACPSPELECLDTPPLATRTDERVPHGRVVAAKAHAVRQRPRRQRETTPGSDPAAAPGAAGDAGGKGTVAAGGDGGGGGDGDAEVEADGQGVGPWTPYSPRSDVSTEMAVVDAKDFGNVARFMNHSCDGNLIKKMVFVESHDSRIPRIAFFAPESIEAGEELTYDYNYKLGSVEGTSLVCRCGADSCRGMLL
ncbi:unnamed protein product [Scytosiphon promiscuus]